MVQSLAGRRRFAVVEDPNGGFFSIIRLKA
jgi:hypothetical protein